MEVQQNEATFDHRRWLKKTSVEFVHFVKQPFFPRRLCGPVGRVGWIVTWPLFGDVADWIVSVLPVALLWDFLAACAETRPKHRQLLGDRWTSDELQSVLAEPPPAGEEQHGLPRDLFRRNC